MKIFTFKLKTGRYTVFKKTFKYHSEKVKFSINFNKVVKVLISLTLKVISPLHKKNTQVHLQVK